MVSPTLRGISLDISHTPKPLVIVPKTEARETRELSSKVHATSTAQAVHIKPKESPFYMLCK